MNHEAAQTAQFDGGKDHRFFDPPSPERPEDILGVDTEALIRLGRSATALGILPYEVSHGLHMLPNATRLFPLVEQMQSGVDEITPQDVRPYRRAIKDLNPGLRPGKNFNPGLRTVDRLAAGAAAVAIGIPLRRAVNRRIDREFPTYATDAIESARQNIEKIEKEVEVIEKFDNPKEQFVAELQQVASSTKQSIRSNHEQRIKQNRDYELPTPKGLFGFFTKVARKVRNFFRFFSRNHERGKVNQNITAYDVAVGVDSTIRSLLSERDRSKQRLPLISHFILDRIPINRLPSIEQIAFMAPEILTSIFSALPEDEEGEKMLDSAIRNPHELRFVTRYKRSYKHIYLDSIQHATRTLLPAIRDVLPTEGKQVRQTFETVRGFLALRPNLGKPDKAPIKKNAKLRDRIRTSLKRN
ncbi:MAG TPA: hypothetical protein VIH90_03940 [Candidatus Saccharimonadales bacterium]